MNNCVGQLQEYLQKLSLSIPEYKDESSSGPSHRPSFVARVSVKWRNGEVLVETGEGRKKKDARQDAASKMLKRILGQYGSGEAYDEIYSSPVPSPSNVKGDLQTAIQTLGLPLPTYTALPPKGPPHDPTFTVKLQIWAWDTPKQELWAGMASGKTKKEAEVLVARQGLELMNDYTKFQSQVEKLRRRHGPSEATDEPETLEEPITHEEMMAISANLEGFRVSYVSGLEEKEAGGGMCLCMGLADSGSKVLPHPVASHGHGSSPQSAERMAALNLIYNISKLFPNTLATHPIT